MLALVGTYLLHKAGVAAWWLLPLCVAILLPVQPVAGHPEQELARKATA